MNSKHWLGLYLSTLAALGTLAVPVQAEEEEGNDDNTLDLITVYGDSYRSTGTKSELQPMEAPMSFERVTAEELEQQQVNGVDDSLRYTTGTSPENRGGAITIFDQYTLRGFSTYNNYYNGLPLQYNETGNLAPQIDPVATEGIELLKGPASVLYGASSPGGMINQIAKQPQYQPSHELQLTTGSNSLLEGSVDSTGGLTDTLDYRLIMSGRSKDGQQQHTEEEHWVIAPSATWYPTDNTSLNLNLYYQDDPKAIPSTPLPGEGTLTEASYGFLEPDTYVGDVNWGNVDKTVTMVGYKLNHDFSDALTLLQNFRYTNGTLDQQNSYFYALNGTDLDRHFYFTDETQNSFVIDNQLAYEFDLGISRHNLLTGLEYHSLALDWEYGDTYYTSSNTLDLTNIDNNQINPDNLDFSGYAQTKDVEESQLGIYLQDEISLNNTTLIAGVRYDKYDATTDTETTSSSYPSLDGTEKTEADQDNVSLRLAAIHEFDNGWSPYVSYSDSYQPLAGPDYQGNPLEPETAYQVESGVKFEPQPGFSLTAAAFFISQQNIASPKDGNANTNGYIQTGETQSKGVELSAKARLMERLSLAANLTVLDAEIVENDGHYEGNTPHLVAEQTANIWADFALTQALSVSGGVRYVGEMQTGNDNTDQVPAYTLVDAASSYAFNDHYSLGVSVSNLLDEEHLSCGWSEYGSPYPSCWYGSPRNIELNFTARF